MADGWRDWSPKHKASWSTLNPGLRQRIQTELNAIAEAEIGCSNQTKPSMRIRLACQRAKIWEHVTEDLINEARESYKKGIR